MKREHKMIITTLCTTIILLIMGFTGFVVSKTKLTTIPVQKTILEPVSLESASGFAVLAGSAIKNKGNTNIHGELGLSPGYWIAGFPTTKRIWTQHDHSLKSIQAKLDLTSAYNEAEARRSNDVVDLDGNIGGLTLTPGLYNSTNSLEISKGELTFDAMDKPNAVFIIQIASSLNTWPDTKVNLIRGAKASNIFWQVGSSATFGANSIFKGTVMALESIKFYDGAKLEGRGLARVGEVDMDSTHIFR
jgi:hypothetical protein